jgi:hypothetical protein
MSNECLQSAAVLHFVDVGWAAVAVIGIARTKVSDLRHSCRSAPHFGDDPLLT